MSRNLQTCKAPASSRDKQGFVDSELEEPGGSPGPTRVKQTSSETLGVRGGGVALGGSVQKLGPL